MTVLFFFLISIINKLGSFPGGSDSKESTCNAGDLALIPGSNLCAGKMPREENGYSTPVFLPGEFHGQRSLAD